MRAAPPSLIRRAPWNIESSARATSRVSAIGLGCMSMSGTYGKSGRRRSPSASSIARSTRASTSSTRPTCTAGGTTRSCSAARSRAGAAPRWSSTKFGQVQKPDDSGSAVDGRPGLRGPGLRREPHAPRRRRDRSLLPAPRGPEGAHRGDGGRHVAAGRARARSATSACREAAPDTIRRAHTVHPISRGAERVLAALPQPGRGDAADLPRARHLLRGVLAARPRLPHRAASRRSRTFPRTTAGASTPASRRATSPTT